MTYTEKNIIKALANIYRWNTADIDTIKIAERTWQATNGTETITFETDFGTVLQNVRR